MAEKLILVTGASSGIGRATAELLAARRGRIVLVARSAERLAEVAAAIEAKGGKAVAFPADLSDPAAVTRLAEAVRSAHGVPDVIVNNAGAGRWLPLVETSPEEARAMIELPYLAAFCVTRAFLPAMIGRGAGQVVFITSPASFMAWPNAAAYIAARHALKGLADGLRAEMRGRKIAVSVVTLGTVSSTYWEHNPGSRERLPKVPQWLLPELTVEQAAETIAGAIERRSAHAVRPAFYRVLFALGLSG